jgi:aminopeptidase N
MRQTNRKQLLLQVTREKRLRLLLLFLLLALSPQTVRAGEASFDVQHYQASLRPDLTERSLAGTVSIRLKSLTNNLSEIVLDAQELSIESVTEREQALSFETKEGRLLVSLKRPMSAGEMRTLTIRYHGKPTRGLRFYTDHLYAAYNTPRWMVCHFHPGDRATLTLSLTVPSRMKVVANGNLVEQKSLPEGQTEYLWQQDAPVPPFVFGFAAGEFQEIVKQKGDLRLHLLARSIYTTSEIERIFADTSDMFTFFEEKAGVSYPGKRYSQVLASGGVMQEMGWLTVIRENYGKEVLAEPRENWLIAHELAHQWWAIGVSCAGWADFWLNEGMAEFMMSAYRERRNGRDEYERDMELARRSYERLRAEGKDRPLAYKRSIKESEAGGPIVYDKGALVLHLLRAELGEKKFWDGVRRYTSKHFGKTVTTPDLQAAMEEAAGRSLSEFFEQWVYSAGVPQLSARHRVEKNRLIVELEQRQDAPRKITLNIAVETSRGRERRRVLFKGMSAVEHFYFKGDLLSVRLDDGAALPFRIPHERPLSMLLYQLAHEPDVMGRADALHELQLLLAKTIDEPTRSQIKAALNERSTRDQSRLIRSLASK